MAPVIENEQVGFGKGLIEIATQPESKGVGFRSITENIDTTPPGSLPLSYRRARALRTRPA